MGNRLKEMLDKKNNGLALTFTFNSLEDRTNFLSAVNKTGETGMPQEVPAPQSIETRITIGSYQYPYKNENDIVKMIVYPATSIFEIPVIVDGAEFKYLFRRVKTNEVISINSINTSVIDVTMELRLNDKVVNFTYKSHPKTAETIDILIQEYKCFLALLDYMFQESGPTDKLEDIRKYYSQSIKEYTRAKQLSEVLAIDLTPKMVIDEKDKERLIEKVYLLLVKNSIIRQNDKLNHIEMVNIENLEIGQELFATYRQKVDLEIFGEHREFYTVNCIFGAEICKVEPNDDGTNVVYFKESEKNPMFRSYSAFIDETAAQKEMDNIMDRRELYEHAVSWMDQLRALLQN